MENHPCYDVTIKRTTMVVQMIDGHFHQQKEDIHVTHQQGNQRF